MGTAGTNRRLLAQVCDLANLQAAWQRVRSKRAAGGIDGQSVDAFAVDADRELDALRAELLTERYLPAPAQEFFVPKQSKPGEQRALGLPAVRDKIAQEAVRRVIEPRLDRLFLDCSYGYRLGRGPQAAIKRVSSYLASDQRWVVCGDIDDFFGSVDHDLLLSILRGHVADEAVLRLLEIWLKMGVVDQAGRWRDVYSGVQQGAVVSPLLANLYLHPFDQSISAVNLGLVRYADDFVICCSSRRTAETALERATAFLRERLSLRLNATPRPIASEDEGFAFLGIWFGKGRRSISGEKCDSARRKLQWIGTAKAPIAERLRRVNEAVAGWRRYYGAVVADDALEPLEDTVVDAIGDLLASEHHSGGLAAKDDARRLIAHTELLLRHHPASRAATLTKIVERAFQAVARPRVTHERTPRRRKRALTTSGSAGAAPSMAIRRRKREVSRLEAPHSELLVTTPGAFIGRTHQRLIVRVERRNVCEIPIDNLCSVRVATHAVSLSADAIQLCADHAVPILFVSPYGSVAASLQCPQWSDATVTLAQARALLPGGTAPALIRCIVSGKIRAQMNLIKYFGKRRRRLNGEFATVCQAALAGMGDELERIAQESPRADLEGLRGRLFSAEGRAAGHYWNVVRALLKPRVEFGGRVRQGATDLVNSLLNYGYGVLQNCVYQAIAAAGLNPHLSLLHTAQVGVPTLAFDLMEEFRPPVVDQVVISLLTRRQPVSVEGDGKLSDVSKRVLLTALQQRLATLVPHRRRELRLEEVIAEQARALRRCVEGSRRYRSFAMKW